VRDVIYDFANGQGKGRGAPDGTRQTASWRSVMLTSGEAAATSFSQDGGTRARVLSITGRPMGSNMKEGGQAAERLSALLQEHYGHFGRKFVHYLVSLADQHDTIREVWRETRDQYAAVARTAVSRRHAGNLATLHMAATFVHELGLPMPDEDPMAFALEAVLQIESEKDRPHAAFIEVVGWCAANQNRFWGRHETDRDDNARVPMRGWAGAWDGREDWTTISLLPHVLREILEPQGFHVDEVLDRWAERGWIKMAVREMANKTVKNRTTVVRINGAPMRVYQFGREAVESHVADDEVLRGEAD
jgi:putative DNA primase/helicase